MDWDSSFEDFKNYQINEHIIEKNNAIFMHDLPAHHGEEISELTITATSTKDRKEQLQLF